MSPWANESDGPTKSSSTSSSPRRATASAGRGTGSTSSTTARRTATTRTSRARTPGRIATTSSARSTRTSRTPASCRSSSPATCCFPARRDGIEALGFIAAGPWDFIGHAEVPETKIDGKIARHLDRDDMVANTISTFCSAHRPLRAVPQSQVRSRSRRRITTACKRSSPRSTARTGSTTPIRRVDAARLTELDAPQGGIELERASKRSKQKPAKAGADAARRSNDARAPRATKAGQHARRSSATTATSRRSRTR